jgi:hypothetical protein
MTEYIITSSVLIIVVILLRKKGIRERDTLIARKPKTLAPALVTFILVAAVAAGCTFTGAKSESDAHILFQCLIYSTGGELMDGDGHAVQSYISAERPVFCCLKRIKFNYIRHIAVRRKITQQFGQIDVLRSVVIRGKELDDRIDAYGVALLPGIMIPTIILPAMPPPAPSSAAAVKSRGILHGCTANTRCSL